MNIYVVDMPTVFSKSKTYVDGANAIKAAEIDISNQMQDLKRQFDEKVAITKSSIVLNPGEKDSAMQSARGIQQQMMMLEKNANNMLRTMHDELLANVEAELTPIVEAAAKEKGASVVLPINSVIYSSEEINITGDVIMGMEIKNLSINEDGATENTEPGAEV